MVPGYMAILQEHKRTLEEKLILNMISQIEITPEISQRALSAQLGVAIGLVNSYLKRCIQKGWIKIQHIPAKRYAYYLTPQGFIEKTKLTGQYLASSFHFFKDAQNQLSELYEQCVVRGWHHVLLVGKGELAEIALLVAKKTTLTILLLETTDFVMDATVFQDFDCVVVTDTCAPQQTFESLAAKMPESKILTPLLLHVSRTHRLQEQ